MVGLVKSRDTYIWNESGATATIADNFAVRASIKLIHTLPPVGALGTDTITRFGIVYTLK